MKSKRRILVGDCSELYRKKKDRRVNLEFHVDQALKDRLAMMLGGGNVSIGVDSASEFVSIGTTIGPVYFNDDAVITQSGPLDESSPNFRMPTRTNPPPDQRYTPPLHANARHTIRLFQDTRPVRYVVHPGTVRSIADGNEHFISYQRLIELYQVSTADCKFDLEWMMGHTEPAWPEEYRIVHLHPQASGDYTLSERDRQT